MDDNFKMVIKERCRVGGCGLDSFGSGQESLAGFCEDCNESSDSMKGEEFLD
jgi:hypothetical protein